MAASQVDARFWICFGFALDLRFYLGLPVKRLQGFQQFHAALRLGEWLAQKKQSSKAAA